MRQAARQLHQEMRRCGNMKSFRGGGEREPRVVARALERSPPGPNGPMSSALSTPATSGAILVARWLPNLFCAGIAACMSELGAFPNMQPTSRRHPYRKCKANLQVPLRAPLPARAHRCRRHADLARWETAAAACRADPCAAGLSAAVPPQLGRMSCAASRASCVSSAWQAWLARVRAGRGLGASARSLQRAGAPRASLRRATVRSGAGGAVAAARSCGGSGS